MIKTVKMDKKTKLLGTVIAIGLCPLAAHADLVINEVMQSNVYCIMDDINEFPDSWVELYNGTDEMIDLAGYKIGTSEKVNKAYTIDKSVTVMPGGHVLIYCDKVGSGLHTDFRVDSGKGSVYLFNPAGEEIDNVTLKKMPAPDIAYGRESDGADTWGYQILATPGSTNDSGTTDVILGDVKFSEPGGVWKDNKTIHVYLELPDDSPEGTYIIYTLDGSEPVVGGASTKVYDKQVLVKRTAVVRAKAVCEGAIGVPSTTQSYIFLGRESKIPLISITVNPEYLYDYNIGIFADGPGGWHNENFRYDWRRPINIEYFEAGEGAQAVLNQLAETRVQGGYTRENPLKSMALYANKRFGTKRFEHEFWAKDKPGVTDNKSFILRNGGNDYNQCYVRDGLMQRVIGRNTDIDWQGYAPVVVYINGKYHAMLALRERSNEDNISANYGGLEDIDMVENWGEDFKAGDRVAFDELMEFIKTDHSWDEWAEKINLESYTNLMALNYWIYNTDFPHNNIMMWRRTDGVDGRWQWLVKDCDFGLGIWNTEENLYKDFNDYLYSNSVPSAGFDIYQRMMLCEEFRQYFIDHLVTYMGDFLNNDGFTAYLNEILAENEGEQQISHDTWNANSWWAPNLPNNLSFMRQWILKRDNAMTNIMRKTWGLGNGIDVKVNTEVSEDKLELMNITYNGVRLTRNVFNGKDYVGRTIKLKADDADNVAGWSVKVGATESEVKGKELTIEITDNRPIIINAIPAVEGIGSVAIDTTDAITIAGRDINGSGLMQAYDMRGGLIAQGLGTITLPSPGIYIVRDSNGNCKKVCID